MQEVVTGSGVGHGLLITGAAGVGKTRLLLESAPAATWVVGTHSAQEIPLAAFSDWVTPGSASGQDPATVLRETGDALLDALGDRVLIVDDAHLLDPLSAALVQRLVLGRRTRVLLTARSKATFPEALTGLWKDGHLDRLELAPLEEDDVRTLLGDALGHPMETHSLRRLVSATGGSTLFLRELVEGELESGGLQLLAGQWYWRAPSVVPETVVDLVRARLDTVPGDVHRVCALLAQAEPLPLVVLTKLTGHRAVEDAERLQLTVLESTHEPVLVRLRHPLYGDALRAATPKSTTHRLREELADALSAASRRGADIALLQQAVLMADSEHADVGILLGGATVAFSWYDFRATERLAAAGERAGGGFPARFIHAGAVVRQGRIEEATERLDALLEEAATPAELAMASSLLACIDFWVHGRVTDGIDRLAQLAAAVADPTVGSYIEALRACFGFFSGCPEEARRRSETALAEPTAEPSTRAWAAAARAITEALAGRLSAAVDYARQGNLALEEAGAERFVRLPLGNGEILALGLAGELGTAESRARDYERLTQAAAGGEMSAAGSFFRGQCAWWHGDLVAARAHLEDALTELADFDSAGWTEQALVVLVQVLAAQGEPLASRERLEELEAADRGVYPAFVPLAGIARAWAAISEGAEHRARRLVESAADEALALDQPAVAVMAWHAACRWGIRSPVSRVRRVADHTEGPRADLVARHAEALAVADPKELDALTVDWLDLGARGAAADTAAQAAVLHLKRGEFAAAQAAAHTAQELATETGGRTPALLALSLPEVLTKREREVATLASTGLSNMDIAARLVLSPRTIEGHLNHAYAKLHVDGRAGLGAALGLSTKGR